MMPLKLGVIQADAVPVRARPAQTRLAHVNQVAHGLALLITKTYP
uniref:Uncharacterized protein n=1 Tax=Arundo donax TaxID=35708 RepID=A0A0A9B778_ARUDO